MGYTLSQVYHCYDNVVLAYKSMGFKEESSLGISHNYKSYRETNLFSDDVISKVSLISERTNIPGFKLPVFILSIVIEKSLNGDYLITECCNKFYYIDDVYFTTDLKELKHAQDTALDRYISKCSNSHKAVFLDLSKISNSLMNYIKKSVDERVSSNYSIRDIYFSYDLSLSRKLIVVIKRDNSSATESLYFNPSVSLLR